MLHQFVLLSHNLRQPLRLPLRAAGERQRGSSSAGRSASARRLHSGDTRQAGLVQDDQPVLVAGQCRVQELTGEQPAGVGEHDEGDAELAALGPMHGQAVGQRYRERPSEACGTRLSVEGMAAWRRSWPQAAATSWPFSLRTVTGTARRRSACTKACTRGQGPSY